MRAADRIQRQMEDVRGQLSQRVEHTLISTRRATRWQSYVRQYPRACIGLAAVIGYLVVPRRLQVGQPDAETLRKLAERNKLVVQANSAEENRGGMRRRMLRFIANAAFRGAMAHIGRQIAKSGTNRSGPSKSPGDASREPWVEARPSNRRKPR